MIKRILGLGLIFLTASALEIALVKLQFSSTMIQTTPDIHAFLSRNDRPAITGSQQGTMLD